MFEFVDAAFEPRATKLTVLWANWRDEVLGVITDPPRAIRPGVDLHEPDIIRLHHIGTIQKVLIDDQVAAIGGAVIAAADVPSVLDELARIEFGATMIVVDGVRTVADTVTYAGLDFALGRNIVRAPFAIVRESPANDPWPELATTR